MARVSLMMCFILVQIWLTWIDAKSMKHHRLNTKALRLATGKKISRPNRPPEEMGEAGAFESDMILTPEQMTMINSGGPTGRSRLKRKAVTQDKYLWPHNVVLYVFESSLPQDYQNTIYQAIHHWESLTCIQFKEYSPDLASELGHTSRVQFSRGATCQSNIGRTGGIQETSIGRKCNTKGSVSHEIGHILGFYHEQSRPDRDDHVHVHMENVDPNFQYNFRKYGPSKIRTDEPYDVGSVMHYGSLYFSRDGNAPTIIPKVKGVKSFMGQRDGLSFMDVKTANDLYHCADHCSSSITCNNYGFIGPDCSCMCPWGLTGPTCDEVIPSSNGCGGVLTAREGSFTTPNYPEFYGDMTECHWLILGPPGSTIELWFNNFEMEEDDEGPCGYDWVEVRTQGPHLSGSKYCGDGPSSHMEYHDNALYIRFYSDKSYSDFSGFKAGYAIQGGEYYGYDDEHVDGQESNDYYSNDKSYDWY